MKKRIISKAVACALMVSAGSAQAVTFETDFVKGAFTTTVFIGAQYSLEDLDPTLNTNLNGTNKANYADHSVPSANIRAIHELDLQFANEWAIFARGTWVKDFEMGDTFNKLNPKAQDAADSDIRLLDLFIEKGYSIGENYGRVRVGNQVLNWGESLFHFGGINYATNPVDIQSAVLPGGQIKEILVPVPMITINQGINDELSFEAYYQFDFEPHRFPPADTYWSTTNLLGPGGLITSPNGFDGPDIEPDAKQYGLTLQYQPIDSITTYGFYYARYNEKFPWPHVDGPYDVDYGFLAGLDDGILFGGNLGLSYGEGIDMYAFSLNTDVGEWAMGAELAYRPNDVIALDPFGGECLFAGEANTQGPDVDCIRESKHWSFDTTFINLMTPNGPMGWLLNAVGGDSGMAMIDIAASYQQGLDPEGTDVLVALDSSKSLSWGYAVEAFVAYEGSLIAGWTVTPGVFFRHNVSGSSHEMLGWWRNEAKEVNAYLNFTNVNDLTIAVQYLGYWGGDEERVVDNRDKDVLALTISQTF